MTAVLIIDDSDADRYILKRQLKKAGVGGPYFEHTDGASAIAFLQAFDEHKALHGDAFPPTHILLDINMPQMTGFEFLEAFRDLRDVRPDLKSAVILMISSSGDVDRERALTHGLVDAYLSKADISPSVLRALLEQPTTAGGE